MAKRVSKDDFDKEVLQSELPVIVDFYSDSCIPCKQLMEKYEVMASPTLVFFKGGEEKDRTRGLVKKAEIEEKLSALLV